MISPSHYGGGATRVLDIGVYTLTVLQSSTNHPPVGVNFCFLYSCSPVLQEDLKDFQFLLCYGILISILVECYQPQRKTIGIRKKTKNKKKKREIEDKVKNNNNKKRNKMEKHKKDHPTTQFWQWTIFILLAVFFHTGN